MDSLLEHPRVEIRSIIAELTALRSDMLRLVDQNLPSLAQVAPRHRLSAGNLLHYIALRRHDIRGLQDRLTALGLSSLGRTEAHVLSAVHSVLEILSYLDRAPAAPVILGRQPFGPKQGRRLLEENTDLLLGPAPEHPKGADHGHDALRGGR
jgi:pyruvate kinase